MTLFGSFRLNPLTVNPRRNDTHNPTKRDSGYKQQRIIEIINALPDQFDDEAQTKKKIETTIDNISQLNNSSNKQNPALTRSQVYALVSVMVAMEQTIPTFDEFTNYFDCWRNLGSDNWGTILCCFRRNYENSSPAQIRDYFNEITAISPPKKPLHVSSWFSNQTYNISQIQNNWTINSCNIRNKKISDKTMWKTLDEYYKENCDEIIPNRFTSSTIEGFVAPYFNTSHTYSSNCALMIYQAINKKTDTKEQLKKIIDTLIIAMQTKYSLSTPRKLSVFDSSIHRLNFKNDNSGIVKLDFIELQTELSKYFPNQEHVISYYLPYICLTGAQLRSGYPPKVRELFSLLDITYSNNDLKICEKNLLVKINTLNKPQQHLTLQDLLEIRNF